MVRAINETLDKSIHHILLDIKDVSSDFIDISFSHIPRSLNSIAHELTNDSFGKDYFLGGGGGGGRLSFGVFGSLLAVLCFPG